MVSVSRSIENPIQWVAQSMGSQATWVHMVFGNQQGLVSQTREPSMLFGTGKWLSATPATPTGA